MRDRSDHTSQEAIPVREGTIRTLDPILARDDRFATRETRRDFRIRTNAVDSHFVLPCAQTQQTLEWTLRLPLNRRITQLEIQYPASMIRECAFAFRSGMMQISLICSI